MLALKAHFPEKIPNKIYMISTPRGEYLFEKTLQVLGPFLPMPYEPDEHKERKDGYPSPDDDFDRDEERDIPLREDCSSSAD